MLTRMTRLLTGSIVATMTTGVVLYQLFQRNTEQSNKVNPIDAIDLRGQDILVGPEKMVSFPSDSSDHPQPTCLAISNDMYGKLTLFQKQGRDSREILVTEQHESMIQCLKEKFNLLYRDSEEKSAAKLVNITQSFIKNCDREMRIWCNKHLTVAGKKEFAKIIARIQTGSISLSNEKLPLGSGGVMLKTTPGRFGSSIMIGFDPEKNYNTHHLQQATHNLIRVVENLLPKDNTLFLSNEVFETKGRTRPGYINR